MKHWHGLYCTLTDSVRGGVISDSVMEVLVTVYILFLNHTYIGIENCRIRIVVSTPRCGRGNLSSNLRCDNFTCAQIAMPRCCFYNYYLTPYISISASSSRRQRRRFPMIPVPRSLGPTGVYKCTRNSEQSFKTFNLIIPNPPPELGHRK